MHRTPRSLTTTMILPLLAMLATPYMALAATLQTQTTNGDLTLVSSLGQTSILTQADGSSFPLPLPATALVHSLESVGEQWYAAGVNVTPTGRRLVVLKGVGAKAKEMPVPVVLDAGLLREPTVLLDAGGLGGLAWIEGKAPRRQSVRVARWAMDGWREPVTIAPPGPGSQMALTSAVLGDGSWLLAWAAFDGSDDEILWSRFDGRNFTSPQLLGGNNSVPDITPDLWATEHGVFAAWSRYDGNDYRLYLSRFVDGSWSATEMIGPKGALYPTFHTGPSGPRLLYHKAVPRSWVVAELNDQGVALREATVESSRSERPLLKSATHGDLSLVWMDAQMEPEITSGLVWKTPSGQQRRSNGR